MIRRGASEISISPSGVEKIQSSAFVGDVSPDGAGRTHPRVCRDHVSLALSSFPGSRSTAESSFIMFVTQVSRTVAPTSISTSIRKRTHTTKAISDANLVVGGATIASLALGRFVFLPFHRNSLAKAGMPKQNGQTHMQAGDRLAEEVTFFTQTNDPAGFSLVDVMAWGALGHAAAFYILATSSLAKSPIPF